MKTKSGCFTYSARLFAGSLTLVFLLLLSCDQSLRPAGGTKGTPFFWKVEKEGKTSYLLGTIHIGVALHELPCSPFIQKTLQASDLIWTESGSAKTEEQSADLAEVLLSPKAKDFKSLDDEDQRFLKDKGLSDQLNYIGYVAFLESLCFKEALGIATLLVSMDSQVMDVAHLSNIPVHALDDSDTLSALDNNFTKEDVEQKIANYPQCLEYAKDFVNQYKTGQLSLNDSSDGKFALKDRNERWTAKFKSAYGDYDQMFVAGGVAHFIGPHNMLDMLREEGFSVQRVSCH